MKSSINLFKNIQNKNDALTPKKNGRYEQSYYANSIKLKNKIIEYDKNHNIKRLIKSNEYEIEKEKQNKRILEKAKRDIEENFDEVKQMNSLMLSAQLASIRDKQIEEKKKNWPKK